MIPIIDYMVSSEISYSKGYFCRAVNLSKYYNNPEKTVMVLNGLYSRKQSITYFPQLSHMLRYSVQFSINDLIWLSLLVLSLSANSRGQSTS